MCQSWQSSLRVPRALAARSQTSRATCGVSRASVWLAHHSQYVPDAIIRDQLQEGRLLELHCQTLPERVVENGIAGHVREVGDQDGVFLAQDNWLTVAK